MFRISDSIDIYNASDKSGVLVFVTELNKVISLASPIGLLLNELGATQQITKDIFMQRVGEFDTQDLQRVWDTLIFEKVLIEGD